MTLVDRHVPPPDRALPLGLDRVLDQPLEDDLPLGILRQVADADPVAAGGRQLDPGDRSPQEAVWDLKEDARAVARVRVRPLGAAMLQILERVERLLDDCMARLTPQLRDERDATAIVLVSGVVEASGPWRSGASVHRGG